MRFLSAACGQSQPAAESGGGDFYRGKTVSIIVGSGAGGGFDTTARLVSRHIGRHIPGEPTVIVVNMPGGGGLVAANHVFSAAAKDGTIVGLFHEAQMMNQLTGGEGVNFDLRQFNWLGSSYDDPNVCLVRTDAQVRLQGLIGRAAPIAVGGTGPGSNTYDAPRVLAAATGANIKAVAGYPTTNDVRVGVERGEIQGMCLGWESVQSASGEWLKDGYAKVIVQNGTTRHPDLQDVPLALEFAKDEDSRTLLRLVDAPGRDGQAVRAAAGRRSCAASRSCATRSRRPTAIRRSSGSESDEPRVPAEDCRRDSADPQRGAGHAA